MAFNNLFYIWELHLFIQQILMKQALSAKYSMGVTDTALNKNDKYSALLRFTANFKK